MPEPLTRTRHTTTYMLRRHVSVMLRGCLVACLDGDDDYDPVKANVQRFVGKCKDTSECIVCYVAHVGEVRRQNTHTTTRDYVADQQTWLVDGYIPSVYNAQSTKKFPRNANYLFNGGNAE